MSLGILIENTSAIKSSVLETIIKWILKHVAHVIHVLILSQTDVVTMQCYSCKEIFFSPRNVLLALYFLQTEQCM